MVVHQIVRSGSRAQLHRGGEAGARLASRTDRNLHFFASFSSRFAPFFASLAQIKMRRQGIFSLKYISLAGERKGVCFAIYVGLHK